MSAEKVKTEEYVDLTGIKVKLVGSPSKEACKTFVKMAMELKAKHSL